MDYSFSNKRLWAKGLLVECPFNKPLDDCPLKEIRTLSLKGRMAVIDNMSDDDLDGCLGPSLEMSEKTQESAGDIK